jgi:hypothetical protein
MVDLDVPSFMVRPGDVKRTTDFAIASRPGPVWSGTLSGCFSPRFSDPADMRSY